MTDQHNDRGHMSDWLIGLMPYLDPLTGPVGPLLFCHLSGFQICWPTVAGKREKQENVGKAESWKVGKSERQKLSGNTSSEGGNEAEYYSAVLATLIHTFYTLNRWSVR